MSSETIGINQGANEHADDPANDSGAGILIVVSSPSGGGKGTLIKRVLRTVDDLSYSVSWTTREPRAGEINGREYHFTTPDEFERMRAGGEFLESASVHNHLYGTAWSGLEATKEGRDIILEIDVQGAASVRARIPDAVSIFILPPSFDTLRERLTARASETPDNLALRLKNARAEVEHYRDFQYVILNDEVERAAGKLAGIITAERARASRNAHVARRVLTTFGADNSKV